MSQPVHNPTSKATDENSRIETKNTTCYMCACRCGIRVTLRDGEVRHIEGNPNHPLNQGVICAKGASGIMKQYSPARLTQPLLRKADAERGSGEFERITWDEALDTIARRFKDIQEKHGDHSIAVGQGTGRFSNELCYRLAASLKTPNAILPANI